MLKLLLFAAIVLVCALAAALAQTAFNPAPTIMVCAYNTTPPTVSTSHFVYAQCDSTGHLILN